MKIISKVRIPYCIYKNFMVQRNKIYRQRHCAVPLSVVSIISPPSKKSRYKQNIIKSYKIILINYTLQNSKNITNQQISPTSFQLEVLSLLQTFPPLMKCWRSGCAATAFFKSITSLFLAACSSGDRSGQT